MFFVIIVKKNSLFYYYFTIAMMKSVVSWNIMENYCVVGWCSKYHGETTVSIFSFSTELENLKSKRIKFVKDRQQNLFIEPIWRDVFFKKMIKK